MGSPASIQVDYLYAHPAATVWEALVRVARKGFWWTQWDVGGESKDYDLVEQWLTDFEESTPDKALRYRVAVGDLDTVVTFELASEGTGARLSVTHLGFDLDSPSGRRAFPVMKAAWGKVLARWERGMGRADARANRTPQLGSPSTGDVDELVVGADLFLVDFFAASMEELRGACRGWKEPLASPVTHTPV